MNLDLIIFDCDGVLIDSELLANHSEVEFLKSFGIEFDLGDYVARFVGKSNKDVLKSIKLLHDTYLPDDFWKLAEEYTFKIFRTELKSITGIFEFLDSIDKSKCVASSSSLNRLDMTLKATELFDRFSSYIFSAEQVNRGKPAPDLFLFAAKQMQVSPDQCIVIEDSPTGVQAGVAAGMTVLGYAGGSHIQAGHQARLLDEGAIKVFEEMSELSTWLEKL
jgi:HAD superfamily hydrolase (TIGR01509 family)